MADDVFKIDRHSDTWRAVEQWAADERADAIGELIARRDPDVQRGRIQAADKLLALGREKKEQTIEVDDYQ